MLFRDINIRKDISLCMVNLGSFGVHCQFYGANEILIFSSSLFADAMAMKAQNCQKTSEVLNILKQIQKKKYSRRITVTSKLGDNFQQCETRRFLMKTDCNSIRHSWISIQKMNTFIQEPPTRIDKIVF